MADKGARPIAKAEGKLGVLTVGLGAVASTFIAGVVLFVFGTGAIKGFAIVLSLGILTSMFTALMGSRALLTLLYGGKRKIAKLAIG